MSRASSRPVILPDLRIGGESTESAAGRRQKNITPS
jgi:hypothetical protein